MPVRNSFSEMPRYARLFRKMPVNASGMDFIHKCRHFPNPDCICSYMVTALMGADMNNIIKTQRLSDDHVQFLVYQVLRAMKVINAPVIGNPGPHGAWDNGA